MILDGYMSEIDKDKIPKTAFLLYVMSFPSNEVYVGISSKPRNRFNKYRSGGERSRVVGKALLKYGLANVYISMVDGYESWEELCEYEKSEIARYNSFKKGYNCTLGGEGALGTSHSVSKEHREKMSNRMKGSNNPQYKGGIQCGTVASFDKNRCRCELCKAAKKKHNERRTPNRKKVPQHGSETMYGKKCRCDLCVKNMSIIRRERRLKRIKKRVSI